MPRAMTGVPGTCRVMSGRMLLFPPSSSGRKFLKSASFPSVASEMGDDLGPVWEETARPNHAHSIQRGKGCQGKTMGIGPHSRSFPPSRFPRPPPPGNPERSMWVTTPKPASPVPRTSQHGNGFWLKRFPGKGHRKKTWIPRWDWYDIKTSKLLYA